MITALQTPGPAQKAGPAVGDSIDSIAGKTVATADDLAAVLATLGPGETVTVSITRSDGTRSANTVALGELPGS